MAAEMSRYAQPSAEGQRGLEDFNAYPSSWFTVSKNLTNDEDMQSVKQLPATVFSPDNDVKSEEREVTQIIEGTQGIIAASELSASVKEQTLKELKA
ncbi:hypothetical protein JRQ81_011214 [Phrynocephalus forsythii]|uniref:Uncharacterized protein n=1 Tax=Phrynocephalus forsythii TaxID=171643 RepID=A0A9Q0Y1P6_9SAUR|nr:hypothetical protein JRQ81_011214 [Phrynocephalus forsythii]